MEDVKVDIEVLYTTALYGAQSIGEASGVEVTPEAFRALWEEALRQWKEAQDALEEAD